MGGREGSWIHQISVVSSLSEVVAHSSVRGQLSGAANGMVNTLLCV